MTLATRCTACGTAFRVVQDQLKVANGWVRCGRCAHVFDASGALFVPDGAVAAADTGADPPPPAGSPDGPVAASLPDAALPDAAPAGDANDDAPVPATAGTASAAEGNAGATADPMPPVTSLAVEPVPSPVPAHAPAPAPLDSVVVDIGIGSVAPRPSLAADQPADDLDDEPPDFVDARFNEELLAGFPGLRDPTDGDDGMPAHATAGAPERERGATPPDAAMLAVDMASSAAADTASAVPGAAPAPSGPLVSNGPTPTFMRPTRRASARRDGRALRVALGASALLLTVGLAAQAAVHWRDVLAARWPPSAPWLAAACRSVGCAIHPLRRIDDLTVDSTTLTPIAPDAPALRLAVTLVNRGDLPLAAPSVDLSLTDTGGELIARKVLHPADFHADGQALTPSATVRWQAVLDVPAQAPEQRVAGYTVELFYP